MNRSSLSNEHLLFAETLRDWRDPLLHGYEPLPVRLCSRCVACKCESLKDLHHTSCPNSHPQRTMSKSKRRANSHDPSISMLNKSSSSSSIITSKSAEYPLLIKKTKSTSKIPIHSPSSFSKRQIPQLLLPRSLPSPTDDLYETDR